MPDSKPTGEDFPMSELTFLRDRKLRAHFPRANSLSLSGSKTPSDAGNHGQYPTRTILPGLKKWKGDIKLISSAVFLLLAWACAFVWSSIGTIFCREILKSPFNLVWIKNRATWSLNPQSRDSQLQKSTVPLTRVRHSGWVCDNHIESHGGLPICL